MQRFLSVAARQTATDMRDPQVAGIDEPDEVGRFVIEQRVRPHGIGSRRPRVRVRGMNMSAVDVERRRIAAVAVDTPETNRLLAMRVMRSLVAFHATPTLRRRLLGRLLREVDTDEMRGDGVGFARLGSARVS
jgi:hypothetical protein